MLVLLCHAPWTPTPAGSPFSHDSLGYAAIWSGQFAGIPGARVDWSAFGVIAAVILFFSIVVGAITFFFREDHRESE